MMRIKKIKYSIILYCIALNMNILAVHGQIVKDSTQLSHRLKYPEYISFLSANKIDSIDFNHDKYFTFVRFPQSKYKIMPNEHLDSIVYTLNQIASNPDILIKRVWVGGSASPEGYWEYNNRLGLYRASALADYLNKNTSIPDSVLYVKNLQEDWFSVRVALDKNSHISNRNRVAQIIETETDSEKRKQKIKAIDKGHTWNQISREIFPDLRNARMAVVCYDNTLLLPKDSLLIENLPEVIPFEQPANLYKEDIFSDVENALITQKDTLITQKERKRVMAVKVNMIFAASLIANVGFETELWPQWSIDIPIWYSPYNLFCKSRKIRLLATQPEIRWWTKSVMDGHFIGLHTHVAGFNIALNDKARYQDPNYPLWGFGGSYGYAKSFGKNERWGIEFNLGIGFATYKYDAYRNWQDGPKFDSNSGLYWGITRGGITISYKWFKHVKAEGRRTINEKK